MINAKYLMHTYTLPNIHEDRYLVNKFVVKEIFTQQQLLNVMQTFGFKRMTLDEFKLSIQSAFSDYILLSLSEIGGKSEDHCRLYMEAKFHLQKSVKLLEGLPHPAGKMAYRLSAMNDTLDKLIDGRSDFSAERATRFVEKNLIRRLRDLWTLNTSTPFHAGYDGSGRNPTDFLLICLSNAGEHYPEIKWFKSVDYKIAERLIKSIKR